jgi:hypothetical protein
VLYLVSCEVLVVLESAGSQSEQLSMQPSLINSDICICALNANVFSSGFTDLSLNDQMRLLQSTWAEILTLTLTYRSLSCTGKLRFASDFTLDEKQARECGAIELYQHVSEPLFMFPHHYSNTFSKVNKNPVLGMYITSCIRGLTLFCKTICIIGF